MNSERDSGHARSGRRPASFADRNVIANAQRQRDDFLFFSFENLAVRVEDEMVFKLAANLVVSAGGRDGELVGGARVKVDVEIHGNRRRVERRPQIGRGRGQNQLERGLASGAFLLRHVAQRIFSAFFFGLFNYAWKSDFSCCSRVRITASSVASRTMGGRRKAWSSVSELSLSAVAGSSSPR